MAAVSPPDPAATRQRLLDAAWRVLTRHGTQALTLDAVAREAEVSKGGLLHHFPSRAALIDALYDRWNDDYETAIATRAGQDQTPGAWVRAYLETTTTSVSQSADSAAEVGVLAALIADPAQLARFRERYERWQRRIAEDGIDPVTATLVRMAADGMWLADLLGLAPATGELRAQLLDRLRELVNTAQPAAEKP